MDYHKKILIALLIYSLAAFVLGGLNVFAGNYFTPAYLFLPLGIFIWLDAFILGFVILLGTVYLLHTNNKTFTCLALSGYATIRSILESVYWLNAQFSQTNRPWEKFWLTFSENYSIPIWAIYVTGQLVMMSLAILFIIIFIVYLKKYLKYQSKI